MAGNQIAKIMLLTVLGVSVLILYKLMAYGSLPDAEFFRKYLVFLTFTENLRPSDFGYFVTVWWFMALIVQCYLLFPFVYRLATGSAWGAAGVALLSMTGAYAFYQPLLDAGVLVYATPLGQLPLFPSRRMACRRPPHSRDRRLRACRRAAAHFRRSRSSST